MSKLAKALGELRRRARKSVGFGGGDETKQKGLLLMAELGSAALDQAREVVGAGCDALLVHLAGKPEEAAWKRLEELSREYEIAIGLRLPADGELREVAKQATESGVDFTYLALGHPLGALEGELGRVVELTSELPDAQLRTLGLLEVDAVTPGAAPAASLTLADLVRLRALRELATRPLLLPLAPEFPQAELSLLANNGIDGIMIGAADGAALATEVKRRREAINRIELKRSRAADELPVSVGFAAVAASPPPAADENDEDED